MGADILKAVQHHLGGRNGGGATISELHAILGRSLRVRRARFAHVITQAVHRDELRYNPDKRVCVVSGRFAKVVAAGDLGAVAFKGDCAVRAKVYILRLSQQWDFLTYELIMKGNPHPKTVLEAAKRYHRAWDPSPYENMFLVEWVLVGRRTPEGGVTRIAE